MPDIPEDIRQAVEGFSVNYVMPDPAEVRQAVAEAILAERNRCADKAEQAFSASTNANRNAGRVIAQAIRGDV